MAARPVKEATRQWVRDLVLKNGLRRIARQLRLADATVARVVAGIDVQESTAAVVEAKHAGERDAA